MLLEEKVLMYSILALFCLFVSFVGTGQTSAHDPDQRLDRYVKFAGLIASIVFWSFALSEIKRIKKNVYYYLSAVFLSLNLLAYAFIFFIISLTLIFSGIGAVAVILQNI